MTTRGFFDKKTQNPRASIARKHRAKCQQTTCSRIKNMHRNLLLIYRTT